MIKLRVYTRYGHLHSFPKVGDVFASGLKHYRILSQNSQRSPGIKYLDFTVEEVPSSVPTYATELLCGGRTWNEWCSQVGNTGEDDLIKFSLKRSAWQSGISPEEYKKEIEATRKMVLEITRSWCGDS